jgi:hypothetical protein
MVSWSLWEGRCPLSVLRCPLGGASRAGARWRVFGVVAAVVRVGGGVGCGDLEDTIAGDGGGLWWQ